jgi:magnesium chelatase family protein
MVTSEQLYSTKVEESSEDIQQRVIAARNMQLQRQQKSNALLQGTELETRCQLSDEGKQLMQRALDKLGLSARASHRVLKVARTIADLAGEADINNQHLAESLSYRRLDRRL